MAAAAGDEQGHQPRAGPPGVDRGARLRYRRAPRRAIDEAGSDVQAWFHRQVDRACAGEAVCRPALSARRAAGLPRAARTRRALCGVHDGACRVERRPIPELDGGDGRFADAHPLNPNPPHSWSTGTSPAVNSHYLRILKANPAIKGKNYNFTTQETDLTAEARQAVAKRVDYVTVGPLEDKTCGGTPAAKVGAKLDATLRLLTHGLPSARLFVTSTRDVARLLQVLGQDKSLQGITVCSTVVSCGE